MLSALPLMIVFRWLYFFSFALWPGWLHFTFSWLSAWFANFCFLALRLPCGLHLFTFCCPFIASSVYCVVLDSYSRLCLVFCLCLGWSSAIVIIMIHICFSGSLLHSAAPSVLPYPLVDHLAFLLMRESTQLFLYFIRFFQVLLSSSPSLTAFFQYTLHMSRG